MRENEEIPMITDEEIQTAFKKLKKCDISGIRAEDIKTCDRNMAQNTDKSYPKKWNEDDAGNCRSICTLPALCEQFVLTKRWIT